MTLVAVEEKHLESFLVQSGVPGFLVHAPDLRGDGGHHPGVGAVAPHAGEGEEGAVMSEHEAGVDTVSVGLGQHSSQGTGLQHVYFVWKCNGYIESFQLPQFLWNVFT